jgi:phosphoglycolate phosphatase
MKVLLWDIDGTLVLTGGAGLRAMNEAFFRLYGIKDAFVKVNLSGRTDTSIIRDALENNNMEYTRAADLEFRNLYYELIKNEIKLPNKNKYVMPGVEQLLKKLAERDDVYLGLLTGNWETSGRTKLGHFGLEHYFSFGAFANDSEIRDELMPYAVKRFEKQYAKTPQPNQVYIIGDTPADILCARPHKAKSIAVGAAKYSVDDLREYNPDYLFEDLGDMERVLEVVG